MGTAALRQILEPLVNLLSQSHTHAVLPSVCERLGLPPLPPREGMSKRERVLASFTALPDAELPTFAITLLANHPPAANVRNQIQDAVWSGEPYPQIPRRARHELARSLPVEDLFISGERFNGLLDRLWVLGDGSDLLSGGGLREAIDRHVHKNRGDWSTEDLFERLGAFDSSDKRFGLFVEGLVSPDVLPDEGAQRRSVEVVNACLRPHGLELRECGCDGGYPLFGLVSTRAGANRPPKNLIFASAVKPDLRFTSAVDNDVEIVTNAHKVLVYDRPIGNTGLRWSDLQRWWSETRNIPDQVEAKQTLYRRLLECRPDTSPPQRLLFESYHRGFRSAVPELPALLPEGWLHWDPKTVKERGRDALFRFRMDFLLLLPHGVRVVIEVDGKQHYADERGAADVRRYAQMAAADRDLKLAGYEVYRFGGVELQGDSAPAMVKAYFESLFKRHQVAVPG